MSKKSTMTSQKKTLQPSARVVLVIAQLNLTRCLHHVVLISFFGVTSAGDDATIESHRFLISVWFSATGETFMQLFYGGVGAAGVWGVTSAKPIERYRWHSCALPSHITAVALSPQCQAGSMQDRKSNNVTITHVHPVWHSLL